MRTMTEFLIASDFKWKSHKPQICKNHQDLQLLFWSLQLKFWISKNDNFKQDFEIANDSSWKVINNKVVQLIDV
jgi:hypothetical protein